MSKRILGLAALLCAVLLASTASAGSPAVRHVSRGHQVVRAQPRMHDATRVRAQHLRTRAVRSAVRSPSSRVVRTPASRVTTRVAIHRQAQTRIKPIKRNWVRCAEPADHCGRMDRSSRSTR